MRSITSPEPGTGDLEVLRAFAQPEQQALGVLGRPGDGDLRELVTLARNLCDADLAAITVIVGQECHHVATVGMDPQVCPTTDSLCTHFAGVEECVVIGDASYDDRFRHSPYVDGTRMRLRFYASAPIHAPRGDLVARLCVFGEQPHGLNPMQRQALLTLAQSTSRLLELRLREDADRAADLGRIPVPGQAPSADAARAPEEAAAGDRQVSEEALRVAAQIGHDIRNPLTTMLATLELLHDTAPENEDPTRVRLLATAQRATLRLDSMVEGLLRLNRIGRQTEPTEIDLDEVARQVLEDSARMLERAGAVVHLGNLPRLVADRAQVYSVLLNLVNNAVKFARTGVPPVIGIQAWRVVGAWRISVTDNGIGIPEEARDQVFQMYSRLDPLVEGNGIGLATVQRIVQAHGGTVGVGGDAGWGAEVWFELPDPQ